MHAVVGDKIVIRGHHTGQPVREAIILAIEGENGAPPYRVRWTEDEHEGFFFPGSDAVIEHHPSRAS